LGRSAIGEKKTVRPICYRRFEVFRRKNFFIDIWNQDTTLYKVVGG